MSKKNRKTIPKKSQNKYEVVTHERPFHGTLQGARVSAPPAKLGDASTIDLLASRREELFLPSDHPYHPSNLVITDPERVPAEILEKLRKDYADQNASKLWLDSAMPPSPGPDTNPSAMHVHFERLAAELGHVEAQFQAANQFGEHREGSDEYESLTTEQLAYARELYELAAEAGHPGAMYRLGLAYGRGRGAPQSNEKSLQWYEKSADYAEDHELKVAAATNAGRMHLVSEGIPRDYEKVRRYFQIALDGDPDDSVALHGLEIAERALGGVGSTAVTTRMPDGSWREDVEGGRRRVRDNDDDEQLREWTYGQTNAEEFENTRRRRREQREGKRNDTK
eukprot:31327-Pelagococcus_subviridis.AAC.3